MYLLAADRLVRLRAPNSDETVVAAGRFTHAFVDGTDTTVCGQPLKTLFWREISEHAWGDLSPMLRCRACETGLLDSST